MAGDSPYKTLKNIRDAIIADTKEKENTALTAQINRYINEGHEKVALRKDRNWLKKSFYITLHEDVSGTCGVTKDSTSVTFSSAATLPTIGADEEWAFAAAGYDEVYPITSISSQTVTLTTPFQGTTNASSAGRVFQVGYFLDSDVRRINNIYQDHRNYSEVEIVGPSEFRQQVQANPKLRDYAAFATIFGVDSDYNQKRLQFYPFPEKDYTLKVDAEIYVPIMSADSDEPILPMQYRQVLYWYGMFKTYAYKRNDPQAAAARAEFENWIAMIDGDLKQETDKLQIQPARRLWFTSPFAKRGRRFISDD